MSDEDASLIAFVRAFLAFARWRAAGAAVLVALGAVLEGFGLLLLVPLLNLVLTPRGPTAVLGGFSEVQRLLILLTAFGILMAARGFVLSQRDRRLNVLQMAFVESIRLRLVARIAGAGWREVAGVSQARIVQALSIEIHQIGVAAHSALLAATAVAMLTGYGSLALALTPAGGAVALAFAAAAALASRPFLVRARVLGRAVTEAHFGMAEGAANFLGGLKLARAEGVQDTFVDEYRRTSEAAMRDRLAFAGQQTALRGVAAALTALTGAAVLVVGVVVLRSPPSVLIALLVVLARMSGPAQLAQQGVQQMLHSLPAYAAVRSLDAMLEPSGPAATWPPSAVGEAVALHAVSYRHPGSDALLLDRKSLSIPSGAFVGLVGPSGAGKTTFLDLAAGLLAPDGGWAAMGEGRERLAYVAQEGFLFDGSIRRNLAWGRPEADEAEMLWALKLVGADALLSRLGLDGRVGGGGGLVSAGERQRLALARAVLRRPRLLILDEATNALDVVSERAVLTELDRLRPDMTILMVSHRAESLAFCDHLLAFPELVLAPSIRPTARLG